MKKIIQSIFYLTIILITLGSCQSVKEGLAGKKQKNSDEFLVQKKNPLSLPPKFKKLPKPKVANTNNNADDIDLREILTKKSSSANTTSVSETSAGSLEKSILEKIKSN